MAWATDASGKALKVGDMVRIVSGEGYGEVVPVLEIDDYVRVYLRAVGRYGKQSRNLERVYEDEMCLDEGL